MKTLSIKGRHVRVRETKGDVWPLDVECLACGAQPGERCKGMISASRHDDDPHHFTREWDANEVQRWTEGKAVGLTDVHTVSYGAKIMHPRK